MGSSDGLRRGMKVKNTGKGSRCRSAWPRWAASWTCWVARSTTPVPSGGAELRHPPPGAEVRRAVARRWNCSNRHQGDRPDLPVRQGRQGRPVRRRRRRQDREHDGADQQHRQAALGLSVFAGVGERTREGNDFYHEMKDSNVLDKVAMVFGQMNEPRATVCAGADRPDHGRALP